MIERDELTELIRSVVRDELRDMRPDLQTFTVRQVADRCRCHPQTIYSAINRGEIRTVSIGRRVVVPALELERFLSVSTAPTAHQYRARH